MPLVQHPSFPLVVREVKNAEEAKAWTDAGWKKVAQGEEVKILAAVNK